MKSASYLNLFLEIYQEENFFVRLQTSHIYVAIFLLSLSMWFIITGEIQQQVYLFSIWRLPGLKFKISMTGVPLKKVHAYPSKAPHPTPGL